VSGAFGMRLKSTILCTAAFRVSNTAYGACCGARPVPRWLVGRSFSGVAVLEPGDPLDATALSTAERSAAYLLNHRRRKPTAKHKVRGVAGNGFRRRHLGLVHHPGHSSDGAFGSTEPAREHSVRQRVQHPKTAGSAHPVAFLRRVVRHDREAGVVIPRTGVSHGARAAILCSCYQGHHIQRIDATPTPTYRKEVGCATLSEMVMCVSTPRPECCRRAGPRRVCRPSR